MIAVLENLPKPEVIESNPHPSGALVSGASVANGLVSVLHDGPVREASYTIGVLGRGTLNLPESEFKQLLACMASMYLLRFPKDAFVQAQASGAATGSVGG